MKAITIKQPWASLIVEGIKDVENRTWPTKFRGRVLIHAGANPVKFIALGDILTQQQFDFFKGNISPFIGNHLGAIIGSVEIVDCVINHTSIWAEKSYFNVTSNPLPLEEENEPDYIVYNWVLANPIKFEKPIPAKGKLSFWDYPNISAAPEEEESGKLFCHCHLPVKESEQVRGDSRFGYYCRYCGGIWYK